VPFAVAVPIASSTTATAVTAVPMIVRVLVLKRRNNGRRRIMLCSDLRRIVLRALVGLTANERRYGIHDGRRSRGGQRALSGLVGSTR
jgi:hypothetical protein